MQLVFVPKLYLDKTIHAATANTTQDHTKTCKLKKTPFKTH